MKTIKSKMLTSSSVEEINEVIEILSNPELFLQTYDEVVVNYIHSYIGGKIILNDKPNVTIIYLGKDIIDVDFILQYMQINYFISINGLLYKIQYTVKENNENVDFENISELESLCILDYKEK